jgi:STE24 endopeptidase
MQSSTLLTIIIAILVTEFLINKIVGYLNYTWFNRPAPEVVKDLLDSKEKVKSLSYKKTNYRFGVLSSTLSFAVILFLLLLDGFAFVDSLAKEISDHQIIVMLVFFGILGLGNELISLPFELYQTFVIEERYGFNNTALNTFISDKLKSYLLAIILGGGLLVIIYMLFNWMGGDFWWVAWTVMSIISVFLNLFYSRLIVPLFNKQEPLEDGELKDNIHEYAKKTGFSLDKILVIDGSKRSSKANAYFSGFGSEKRVTLYDTLISKLSIGEIVAVLAHEIGHYKKKHIVYNMILGIGSTGLLFFLFSIMIDNPMLSEALGVSNTSFHVGLIAFGLLYSPVSMAINLFTNSLSRKFEYQADAYAANTHKAEALASGLKTLSKDSLSNLTPHPAYVWFHYSHPPLADRLTQIL